MALLTAPLALLTAPQHACVGGHGSVRERDRAPPGLQSWEDEDIPPLLAGLDEVLRDRIEVPPAPTHPPTHPL